MKTLLIRVTIPNNRFLDKNQIITFSDENGDRIDSCIPVKMAKKMKGVGTWEVVK